MWNGGNQTSHPPFLKFEPLDHLIWDADCQCASFQLKVTNCKHVLSSKTDIGSSSVHAENTFFKRWAHLYCYWLQYYKGSYD